MEARDSMGRTALMWAALAGKSEAVDLLLARGADTLALERKAIALSNGHCEKVIKSSAMSYVFVRKIERVLVFFAIR